MSLLTANKLKLTKQRK